MLCQGVPMDLMQLGFSVLCNPKLWMVSAWGLIDINLHQVPSLDLFLIVAMSLTARLVIKFMITNRTKMTKSVKVNKERGLSSNGKSSNPNSPAAIDRTLNPSFHSLNGFWSGSFLVQSLEKLMQSSRCERLRWLVTFNLLMTSMQLLNFAVQFCFHKPSSVISSKLLYWM